MYIKYGDLYYISLGKKGMPFVLNNRLDIYDKKMWRDAIIVEIKGKEIKVKYKGISSKYDEWIHTEK